jgi:hypothetical protein
MDKFEEIDISMESVRVYTFSDGSTYTIYNPLKLFMKGTSHRILDADGFMHWVPTRFLAIKWKPKQDGPLMVR